jgi:hypothetical protein
MPHQRHERIDVFGELKGEVMVYQSMTVTQISETGARIETPFPLLPDSLHDFRLTLGELSVVVKARIVHCSICDLEHGGVTYRAGVEFVEPSEHVGGAIKTLIDRIRRERSGARSASAAAV